MSIEPMTAFINEMERVRKIAKARKLETSLEISDDRLVKVSRYLSKILRHQPEKAGLTLQAGGWVKVDDLLRACAQNRMTTTREELEVVVASSNKQRFAFDETGT